MNKTKICSNKKSLAFLFFYATLGFSVSSITSSCGSENNLQKQAGNEEGNFLKKIEEFNKNITTLQTKLNNSELKGAMQKKVENLSDSIKKFQDKLESNQSKDGLQQDIESLCKEIKDLKDEIKSNQPESDNTKIENLCNEMENLQNKFNESNAQLMEREDSAKKINLIDSKLKKLQQLTKPFKHYIWTRILWINVCDDYNPNSDDNTWKNFYIINLYQFLFIFENLFKNYDKISIYNENIVYNENSIKDALYKACFESINTNLKDSKGTVNKNKGIYLCYDKQLFCNGKENKRIEKTSIYHGTLMDDSKADNFKNEIKEFIYKIWDDIMKHE